MTFMRSRLCFVTISLSFAPDRGAWALSAFGLYQWKKSAYVRIQSKGELFYFFNMSQHFIELLLFVCCLIVRPFHNLTLHLYWGVKITALARFLPRTRAHGRPKWCTVGGTICVWNVVAMNVHDKRAKGTHCQGLLFSFSLPEKSYIFKNLPLTH